MQNGGIEFTPDTINAISGLVTTFTGFITVLGGIYVAVLQHRIGRKIDASVIKRAAEIQDVKGTIEAKAAEITKAVANGKPHPAE